MIQNKHKGAASELIALIWLLNEGYDVYRNVSAHGIADMVAIKDNEIIKIDVKSGSKRPQGFFCVPHTEEQIKNNIRILMIDRQAGIVHGWLDYKKTEFIDCICGKKQIKKRSDQKWCSPACRKIAFDKNNQQ